MMRLATQDDYQQVWRILRQAAQWMMDNGRDQWDEKYPTAESLQTDIDRSEGWVMEVDGKVVGYCAIALSGEPSYDALEGKWLTPGPYTVVHRMAIDLDWRGHGLAKQFFVQAEQIAHQRGWASVRVDTNHDNAEMLHLIAALGYKPTGKCYYFHGGRNVERLAFELPLSKNIGHR